MTSVLSARGKARVERGFEVAVITAAVATLPLTYAHMQQWDGVLLTSADWLIWGVFAGEYVFRVATAADRVHTAKAEWVNLGIAVLSFPLLPHLLGLTRLVRLVGPLRLAGGLRIARPIAVLRLYAVRAVGGRLVLARAKETGQVDEVRDKADEAGDGVRSLLGGAPNDRD